MHTQPLAQYKATMSNREPPTRHAHTISSTRNIKQRCPTGSLPLEHATRNIKQRCPIKLNREPPTGYAHTTSSTRNIKQRCPIGSLPLDNMHTLECTQTLALAI